jgi:hypothetical protein
MNVFRVHCQKAGCENRIFLESTMKVSIRWNCRLTAPADDNTILRIRSVTYPFGFGRRRFLLLTSDVCSSRWRPDRVGMSTVPSIIRRHDSIPVCTLLTCVVDKHVGFVIVSVSSLWQINHSSLNASFNAPVDCYRWWVSKFLKVNTPRLHVTYVHPHTHTHTHTHTYTSHAYHALTCALPKRSWTAQALSYLPSTSKTYQFENDCWGKNW